MKQSIRYFAVGLLTSSVILFFAFSFMGDSAIKVEDGSTEELIDAVEADGYHVLSSSEYISLSTKATSGNESEEDAAEDNAEDADDKADTDKKEKKVDKKSKDKKKNKKTKKKSDKKDKKENDKTHKYTINIKENMLAPTISDLLKENKIIDNSADFNKYLEDKGYAPYVQLGKHKVNSEMSYKDIAEVIAKKK